MLENSRAPRHNAVMAAVDELRKLGLSDRELAALARQGFVASERLPSGNPCYKLRFRCDGRQRVCYLGQIPEFADYVRDQLAQHQRPAELRRQITHLPRETARAVRQLKREFAEQLAAAGLHFHGLELRCSRNPQQPRHARSDG